MSTLQTTPLHAWHIANGATMMEFAGWEIQKHYATGAVQEHLHTRKHAGIFDVSHTGEFLLYGPDAAKALEHAVTANISTLKPSRCRYGFVLTEQGTIADDLIIYRFEENSFMLVLNPHCNKENLTATIKGISSHLTLEDISSSTAKIDIQGPESFLVLESIIPEGPWKRLPFYSFTQVVVNKTPLIISRSGYTGELGVEMYLPWDAATTIWQNFLQDSRVMPIGIDARASLRLEAGLPFYGLDLNTAHTPAEAGFTAMLTSESSYIGKEQAYTVHEKLVPFILEGNTIAQQNDRILSCVGEEIGHITSCNFSPCLNKVIALGYIKTHAIAEKDVIIQSNNQNLPATVTTLPFYTLGTARELLL